MDELQRLRNMITERDAAIERLRLVIEDAIETLEAMDLYVDNPLYDRLRKTLEPDWR